MSEYIPWEPTTEDIRERYSDWYDGPEAPPVEVAEAEFHRWLMEHEMKIIKATKELIIEALEEERLKHLPWCGEQYCVKCEQTIGIENAIVIVKGETE